MYCYLFIWTIMAGATSTPSGSANYQQANWKGQWVNSGKFDRAEYCHKTAATLGLKKEEYRCVAITGEQK